jgi:hypothetical protein
VNGSRGLLKPRADDELRVGGPDGICPSVWVKVESVRNPNGCADDTVSREAIGDGQRLGGHDAETGAGDVDRALILHRLDQVDTANGIESIRPIADLVHYAMLLL